MVYNLKGFRFESIEGVPSRVGWALALEMSMFNLRLVKRGLSGVRFSLRVLRLSCLMWSVRLQGI